MEMYIIQKSPLSRIIGNGKGASINSGLVEVPSECQDSALFCVPKHREAEQTPHQKIFWKFESTTISSADWKKMGPWVWCCFF